MAKRTSFSSKTISSARKAANLYQREWRRRNPEKSRAIQLRYWAKRAAALEAEAKGDKEQEGMR